MMKTGVTVNEATHVKIDGEFVKIKSKWGVGPNGQVARMKEGGFGVVTEDGRRIDMWSAQLYGREE
jgi:hypothetical protein